MKETIQETVARHGTAEIFAWRAGHQGFAPEQVDARPIRKLNATNQVWHAYLPIDHFHPYTLLQNGQEVLRLGGFQEPDLQRATQLLRRGPMDHASARDLARELAMLLDPNAAERFVFPGDSARTDARIVEAWIRSSRSRWPRDTVFQRERAGWLARVSLLSQQTHSYETMWLPIVCTFVFSSDGSLTSWFMRQGDPFPAD